MYQEKIGILSKLTWSLTKEFLLWSPTIKQVNAIVWYDKKKHLHKELLKKTENKVKMQVKLTVPEWNNISQSKTVAYKFTSRMLLELLHDMDPAFYCASSY